MLEHLGLQDLFWAIVYLRAAIETVVWLVVVFVVVIWGWRGTGYWGKEDK